MLTIEYIPMHYYDAIIIHFTDDDGNPHIIIVDGGEINSAKYCYTDRLKGKLEEIFNNGESIVNGNQQCSNFGNSECSIFGIKTTVLLASAVQ